LTGSNTNHVFWSIGVETKVYFVFPIALFLWTRIGSYSTCALLILASLMLPILVPSTAFWVSHYCGLFVMGMLAADLKFTNASKLLRPLKVCLVLSIALMCVLNWTLPGETLVRFAIPIHLLVGGIGAVTMCLLKNGQLAKLRTFLSGRWLMTIGLASYSLYLIHAPLLQIFSKYVTHPLLKHLVLLPWEFASLVEYVMFLLIAIPLIVVISMGFAYVFEGTYYRKGLAYLAARHGKTNQFYGSLNESRFNTQSIESPTQRG
jgi:peptidoglycan/LPS O-acetylase OafA/YrhL